MEAREGISVALRRVGASVRSLAGNETPDVVQEAVARALRSGVSLEAEQWLRTVARRVAIDQARRRRELPSGAPTDLEGSIRYHDGDPAEMVVRAERDEEVRRALEALPPRYRRVLEVYLEEDSPGAVATRMGMSAGAAWTLLSRARSRLRLELEQAGFVPAMAVGGHGRWRELAAAGAAAVIATGAALAPSTHEPAEEPAQPVQAEVAQSAPAADPAPDPAPVASLEETAKELILPVSEAVDEVATIPDMVQVGDCAGEVGPGLLGAEVKLDVEFESALLAGLADLLPDELRHIKLCL